MRDTARRVYPNTTERQHKPLRKPPKSEADWWLKGYAHAWGGLPPDDVQGFGATPYSRGYREGLKAYFRSTTQRISRVRGWDHERQTPQ